MILIYPPVARPSEPPAGIAKLSGALTRHGVEHRLVDANLEGLLYLIEASEAPPGPDRWTARAFRNRTNNLAGLRSMDICGNIDRYKRVVSDISRVLATATAERGAVGLANYRQQGFSPVRSGDLLAAAEDPERNPFYPYFRRRLTGLLEESPPSLVGFSLNYLSQALCTFAMAGFLKKVSPGTKIVLGGGLVTSWMKSSRWQNPFKGLVDHIIAGPGEAPLLSLLCGENVFQDHCTPVYDALPLRDYLSPGVVLPYSGSHGCYWRRCSFCPERAEGNPYVPVPADRALADLQEMVGRARPDLIHLVDNAVGTGLLKALPERPLSVPWYGFARIDPSLADREFCMALKRSGCVMLKLGLESGDQEVLDNMEKGIRLDTVSLALRALKEAGIATYVYLMFGTPAETPRSARKTLEFVVRHNEEIGFLNLALFNMPISGPEAGGISTGTFYEGDLSLYTDFSHPEGWNRRQVRGFLENEFKSHPAVSLILRRDPPVFTSSHAPFFIAA